MRLKETKETSAKSEVIRVNRSMAQLRETQRNSISKDQRVPHVLSRQTWWAPLTKAQAGQIPLRARVVSWVTAEVMTLSTIYLRAMTALNKSSTTDSRPWKTNQIRSSGPCRGPNLRPRSFCRRLSHSYSLSQRRNKKNTATRSWNLSLSRV